MKKTIEVKRGVSNAVVSEVQSEMKIIRKEMRLLQAQNMSLRADNLMLRDNMKTLIEKVNSLEEKDPTIFSTEGKDPPGSFEEDGIAITGIVMTDSNISDKENAAHEDEEVAPVNGSTGASFLMPQKNLAYRNRIRSRMSYSPKMTENEVETPEKTYLGLTGRRSEIYKEINRMKSSSALSAKEKKNRRQTMGI